MGHRAFGQLALVATLVLVSSPGRAEGPGAAPKAPIGFSKLVVRIDGTDEVGIAANDFHVRMIERMRARGFEAVGAENLVFEKDESRRAEYLVGGTVREVACRERAQRLGCRVGVEWQVLDVETDQVVYTVMNRIAVTDTPVDEKDRMAGRLLDGAMDALLYRPRFRQAIAGHGEGAPPPSTFSTATIQKCRPGRKLADSAEDLLRAVVVVKEKGGFGSGFFVSPEGLVMTAAHVVEAPKMTLRLRDGTEVQAVPVRIAARDDVALLRTQQPLSAQPCVAIRADTPSSGTEVYAAGAPASLDLAFSLTRGIVSGLPLLDGRRRLQTDAPVSPGNSGGPLADAGGSVVGVVSSKIVAARIEGLAFAVPMPEALAALGLRVGDSTDGSLLTETAPVASPERVPLSKDTADPVPSVDPEGDELRAERAAAEHEREEQVAAEKDRDRRTPFYVPLMRWGGLTLAGVGAITILGTFTSYHDNTTTEPDFDVMRNWNTAGWIALGVGAASFVLSFPLRPSLARHVSAPGTLRVGAGGVAWQGAF